MAEIGQNIVSVPVTSGDNVATQQVLDAVHLAVSQLNNVYVDDGSSGEPARKRIKTEDSEVNMEQSLKQILFNINKAICLRLDTIENKLETVCVRTKYLEEKVEMMSMQMKHGGQVVVSGTPVKGQAGRRSSAVIVGLPQERTQSGYDEKSGLGGMLNSSRVTVPVENEGSDSQSSMSSLDQSIQNLGPNVQLITLNTEEDFPHGTWLGDENNPEMRVRVPITPSDLLHVHSNCRTPEKMALSLIDYLFDRDTQSVSNLSGSGKHGKKQLDPLMIYGIRCHLIHRFGITEQDWHRIKQNIDSKCRTAFRRKVKGLPLTVKAFRGKAPPTYVHMSATGAMHEINSDDSMTQDESELTIHQVVSDVDSDHADDNTDDFTIHHMGEVDLAHAGMLHSSAAEIIQSAGGEIQVLHATPEQVAQLQQTHQIQILQGDEAQMMFHTGDGSEGIQVVSMSHGESGNIAVVSETGETIHINQELENVTDEPQ